MLAPLELLLPPVLTLDGDAICLNLAHNLLSDLAQGLNERNCDVFTLLANCRTKDDIYAVMLKV